MNREEKLIKEILEKGLKDKEHREHPDEMTLSKFIERKLEPEKESEVINHLLTCKQCRDVVMKASNLIAQESKDLQKTEKEKRKLKKFFIPVSFAASVLLAIFLYSEYVNKKDDFFIPKGEEYKEKTFPEKVKEEIEKIIEKIKRVFEHED